MQPGPLASQSSSRKVDFSSAPSGAAGAERVQTASPREEGLCPLRCPIREASPHQRGTHT